RLRAFLFQAEDGIRDFHVTGVQTCALPISVPLGRLLCQVSRVVHLESRNPQVGPHPEPARRQPVCSSRTPPSGCDRIAAASSPRSAERSGGEAWRSRSAPKGLTSGWVTCAS